MNDYKATCIRTLRLRPKRFWTWSCSSWNESGWELIEASRHPELLRLFSQAHNDLRIGMAAYLETLLVEGNKRGKCLELAADLFYGVLFQYILAKCRFPGGSMMSQATAEEFIKTDAQLFTDGIYNQGECWR